MPDFNVRADSVNVEQIMDQIRARIREKRGVDYTEDQIRELASVKLEKFLDARGVRSDLLDQFKRAQVAQTPPAPPNYRFEEDTLFETHRGPVRFIRRLLQPLLKLMFNPGPLIQALNIQSQLNTLNAQQETARRGLDQLHFEVLHNLVLETTRMGIEVKNLKMRVESLTSRLEFNERRARALESVVVYKPADTADAAQPPPRSAPGPQPEQRPRQQDRRGDMRDRDRGRPPQEPRQQPPMPAPQGDAGTEIAPVAAASAQPATSETPGVPEGPGQRSRRRRRRRGRRGGGSVAAVMGGAGAAAAPPTVAALPADDGPDEPDDVDPVDTDFSSLIDSSTSSGFREEPSPSAASAVEPAGIAAAADGPTPAATPLPPGWDEPSISATTGPSEGSEHRPSPGPERSDEE